MYASTHAKTKAPQRLGRFSFVLITSESLYSDKSAINERVSRATGTAEERVREGRWINYV